MLLTCEGKSDIFNPKSSQIRRVIRSLRSYGPSSYAAITDDSGNYLQVAGGGVTCLLERYFALNNSRMRAFREVRSKVFPDGTLLVCRSGEIPLMADEWFMADQVEEAFCSFCEGKELPANIYWRAAPGF